MSLTRAGEASPMGIAPLLQHRLEEIDLPLQCPLPGPDAEAVEEQCDPDDREGREEIPQITHFELVLRSFLVQQRVPEPVDLLPLQLQADPQPQ